jgi:hypothetical protein
MVRVLTRRVLSAMLILVMGVVTNAPALDALLFHGKNHNDVFQPHYDSSRCHAERCAIEYPARDSRLAPLVTVQLRILTTSDWTPRHRAPTPLLSSAPLDQNHSRAPPSIV